MLQVILYIKLENIYKRWKLVVNLIIKYNGDNQLIEAKLGKLYQEPSPVVEDLDEENTRHAVDDNNLTLKGIFCSDQDLEEQ